MLMSSVCFGLVGDSLEYVFDLKLKFMWLLELM